MMRPNSTSTRDAELPFLYSQEGGGLLSQEQASTIADVYTILLFLFSLVGIMTNGLNIKAFLATGKEDGISVSLLSLSISDFGFCMSCFLYALSFVFVQIEKSGDVLFPLDPWIPCGFIIQFGTAFLAMTVLNTTFLAVTRCMCVVKPLQFSNTFTRSRSIAIHTCIALVSLCGYIPIMTQMGGKRAFNVLTNQTRFVVWMSDKREDVKDVVYFIFDTLLTFTVLVLLIICVFIMAYSLRKSVRFRQANKAQASGEDGEKDKQSNKLSGKELQVIQQLILISTIFIVCSVPRIFMAIYSIVEPGFDLGKRLHHFYFAISQMRQIFEVINSASTFFIYFKYNSRFRDLYSGRKATNTNK